VIGGQTATVWPPIFLCESHPVIAPGED